ncbi:carbohydrate-binding protein [Micromonospora sp. BRA006-A]|nr:carbohydrate-binding protein [Micromonospora sp. BRA006-A]
MVARWSRRRPARPVPSHPAGHLHRAGLVGGHRVLRRCDRLAAGRTWSAKWWTQGETPGSAAVWADQGACSGSPTPTTSRTPTGSPSPTGGACAAPAWAAGTAYPGGAVVSYGGHRWTSRWWTQGDVPGTNSQGVWTDNGPC